MAQVQLSRGLTAIVDDADLHLLTGYSWYAKPIIRETGGFYACATIGGKTTYMHRLLLAARKGEIVDHANGDGLDNRRANIRLCSLSQNNANSERGKGASTGLRGVYLNHNGFRASVGRGKAMWKGPTRKNPIVAAVDYDREAARRFGKFARLNFPCIAKAKGGAA